MIKEMNLDRGLLILLVHTTSPRSRERFLHRRPIAYLIHVAIDLARGSFRNRVPVAVRHRSSQDTGTMIFPSSRFPSIQYCTGMTASLMRHGTVGKGDRGVDGGVMATGVLQRL